MEADISKRAIKEKILSCNRSLAFTLNDEVFAPLVSLVICTRNGFKYLNVLFNSFRKCIFYNKFEVIIVDNASSDESINFLEKQKEDFSITIIRNNENETFSEASNRGAAIAKGEYLLFLNNDIEVTDYWLDELLKVARTHENAGAIGARLVYPEITHNSVNSGKDYKMQHAGIAFHRRRFEGKQYIRPYNKGNGNEPFAEDNQAVPVAAVTAACLLMKKSVFTDIGGFDEHYVYGYEDVDLNLKALRKGYTNYYCPTALLFHYEFGEQQNDDKREVSLRRKNNLLYFTRRWHAFLQQKLLQDKISCARVFSEKPLTVALAVKEKDFLSQKDSDIADFETALESQGYTVTYLLCGEETDWYDIGNDTDIIISTTPEYDVTKIKTADPYIITFAWIRDNLEIWCGSAPFPYYRFILTESESDGDYVFLHGKRVSYVFEKQITQVISLAEMCYYQFAHKLMILTPVPNQNVAEFWGDYHFAVAIKKCFERRGYETEIRCFNEWEKPFDGTYVLVLRGLKPYVPQMKYFNVMWNISHPDDVGISEYNTYDINYISSEIWAEHLKGTVRMPVIPLLQCTDTDVFTGEQDKKCEKTQVLFVGNTRGVFRDTIRNCIPANYQVSVYGQDWEKFIESKYIKGIVIPNKDLNDYYSNCDVLLNDHWADMKEKGFVSNRIFDGLAAGAFIITDKVEGMDPELRQCVAVYENGEDLRNKIGYYLQHPEERTSMASKGQELVRNKHTFQQRVDTMIRFLEEKRNP